MSHFGLFSEKQKILRLRVVVFFLLVGKVGRKGEREKESRDIFKSHKKSMNIFA